MTVQRILIVSGTHGNEINPVWAVKQFNREENSFNHGIEYVECLVTCRRRRLGNKHVLESKLLGECISKILWGLENATK